jgi:hypothetical protein
VDGEKLLKTLKDKSDALGVGCNSVVEDFLACTSSWIGSPALKKKKQKSDYVASNNPILKDAEDRKGFVLVFCFFGTGSQCVSKAGLELSILLPQSPVDWNYRCAQPHLATVYFTSLLDIIL